jgi:predicted RNase H-related nuclease YkuK (DUF458 family)
MYLTYFFTFFLRMNAFTAIAPYLETSLSSLVHNSSKLRDATTAVSALHITQRNQSGAMQGNDLTALQAYASSFRYVQARITSNSLSRTLGIVDNPPV